MKYVKIFTDFLEVTEGLSDGAMGRLFRAMLLYAQDGTAPELRGKEAVAWAVARQQIDREREIYEKKVKQLKRGSVSVSEKKSSVSEQDKDKDKDKDKDNDSLSSDGAGAPEKREKKPTPEEVLRFSQEEVLTTDVDYFYNYYEANGWRIGKYPIRDWRAALRAWSRKAPSAPKPENSVGDNFRIAMEMMKQKEAKRL